VHFIVLTYFALVKELGFTKKKLILLTDCSSPIGITKEEVFDKLENIVTLSESTEKIIHPKYSYLLDEKSTKPPKNLYR
jgi:hypothetical protein